MSSALIWILLIVALGSLGALVLLRWGMRWGSTCEERARDLAGDELLDDAARSRVVMTRAISIEATPSRVWPWIAQLGRGAGWYSVDWLDNGRRVSARHIVSWIPEPRLGDATTIGYLRHLESGRAIAWWVDGVGFAGAKSRLVTSYVLEAEAEGTRLISRMSADATGATALLALWIFRAIDSIMAIRQLMGVRCRIESAGEGDWSPPDPETGARDQYQSYEVLYAGGGGAGAAGLEDASRWRRLAGDDGFLAGEE